MSKPACESASGQVRQAAPERPIRTGHPHLLAHGREDPARAVGPGHRGASTIVGPAERTVQDLRFWMLVILISAESKSAPNGGS
jgi:hypothetical protein